VPDQEWMLRNIRGTRANPPGLAAGDAHRRAIYSAGLEQFEQLLEASRTVGPAARPLPLFYALSQAGRAIVAARGDQPEIGGHGLSQVRERPEPPDLLRRRIKRVPLRDGRDSFGAVSRAIGSPDFSGWVEIGALWVALPGTHRIPEEAWHESWRPALAVLNHTDYRAERLGMIVARALSYSGNPYLSETKTLEGRYPSLPADTRSYATQRNENLDSGSWGVDLIWSAQHRLDAVAPADPSVPNESHSLLPTLPGQDKVLNPLMTWWILLFGLSLLTRYEPESWLAALNVDQSPLAVPLEAVLQRALAAVPALLHEELLIKIS
jgi:hypothetical protein